MQHRIAVGLSTAAGIIIAAASLVAAVIATSADVHILGFSDQTLAKVSGLAVLVVSIGRYLQSIARELSGTPSTPDETSLVDPSSLGAGIN